MAGADINVLMLRTLMRMEQHNSVWAPRSVLFEQQRRDELTPHPREGIKKKDKTNGGTQWAQLLSPNNVRMVMYGSSIINSRHSRHTGMTHLVTVIV